jgi:hypothetical protein
MHDSLAAPDRAMAVAVARDILAARFVNLAMFYGARGSRATATLYALAAAVRQDCDTADIVLDIRVARRLDVLPISAIHADFIAEDIARLENAERMAV